MSSRRTTLRRSESPPPALLPASGPPPGPALVSVPEFGPPPLISSTFPPKMKPRAVMLSMPGRCVERGCVFPAMPGAGGRCMHHQRQQQEPGLYSSQQPSSALVARGKFGPPRIEEIERAEERREHQDRRRLMAEREQFLSE
jgi:hypothetical protein